MMLYNINNVDESLHQLELIDVLQRLGVSYHFETEINNILENHYKNINKMDKLKGCEKDLYATSLQFRLLRQHGYHLSTEMFDRFVDETGNFKKTLSIDIKGMVSLYEASFLEVENESILEKARVLSQKIMKEYVRKEKENNGEMLALINHALELPLHWRMDRWEALWFINAYETCANMIPALLQFAKLDFNMLQAIYLEELKDVSRKFLAKLIALGTTIDDVYDVYGSLEELELFTQTVDRWDINAIDDLPHYMKECFLTILNLVDELAFDILKWAEFCKAYLVEAKWYYSGYKPTLQEYIENAWISVATNLVLVHVYFFIQHPIRKEDLDYIEEHPLLFRYSGTIVRLVDDLATSKDEMVRGDVPKAIQCYMNEFEACEEDSREYLKSMIRETWKKINEQVGKSCLCGSLKDLAMSIPRTAQWFYQYGDGYGVQDNQTKSRILSLLMEPIPY
ncbi:terpene synthase [Senna tora]|uniref:Terpene synthase n=1 Tax=Senna tora TaxID=362788 RepID=A0A835C9R6_9FABA|nr:terpene synthase [Senna tora]